MKFDINGILLQERLAALAHEAIEAYEVVTERYKNAFGLGCTEIDCYSNYFADIHCSAIITVNGTWEYRSEYYPGEIIVIPLTKNGIFTCYVADFVVSKLKSLSEQENTDNKDFGLGLTPGEMRLSIAAESFRDFVTKCRRELKKEKYKNETMIDECEW